MNMIREQICRRGENVKQKIPHVNRRKTPVIKVKYEKQNPDTKKIKTARRKRSEMPNAKRSPPPKKSQDRPR